VLHYRSARSSHTSTISGSWRHLSGYLVFSSFTPSRRLYLVPRSHFPPHSSSLSDDEQEGEEALRDLGFGGFNGYLPNHGLYVVPRFNIIPQSCEFCNNGSMLPTVGEPRGERSQLGINTRHYRHLISFLPQFTHLYSLPRSLPINCRSISPESTFNFVITFFS